MNIPIESAGEMSFAEVRKWLWQCRENEIVHMWQRGAFLATFIIGTFTAYAKLLCNWKSNSVTMAAIALAISVIGIVLSLLWIAMAKGSSAWYSIYERAMSDLVKVYFRDSEDEHEQLLLRIVGKKCPLVGYSKQEKDEKWSKLYFNGRGGRFSLPKINIAMGHLLSLIWLCIFASHGFLLVCIFHPQWMNLISRLRQFSPWLILGGAVLFIVLYLVYAAIFLNSKSLSDYEKDLVQSSKPKTGRTVFHSIRIVKFFMGKTTDL